MSRKFYRTKKGVFFIATGAIVAVAGIAFLLNKYLLHLDYHTLVLGVLAVIDIVLIVVVIIEVAELQEHKAITVEARDRTVEAMDSIAGSVRLLERDKVYVYLDQTASNADEYVHHVSFSQSSTEIKDEEERKRVQSFLKALETACNRLREKHGEPDVKILGPDMSTKIGGLWERNLVKGVEVHVSPNVPMYDIRIQIVDDKYVVIGIAEPAKESERGFLIESKTLAILLDDMFLKVWSESESLEDATVRVMLRYVVGGTASVPDLTKLMKGSLHTNDETSKQIIKLLVDVKKCLTRDETDTLYHTEALNVFQQHCARGDDELKKCLADKGINVSPVAFAKFKAYVVKLNGGKDGNAGAGQQSPAPGSSQEMSPPTSVI